MPVIISVPTIAGPMPGPAARVGGMSAVRNFGKCANRMPPPFANTDTITSTSGIATTITAPPSTPVISVFFIVRHDQRARAADQRRLLAVARLAPLVRDHGGHRVAALERVQRDLRRATDHERR